jgi:hypothetical protein
MKKLLLALFLLAFPLTAHGATVGWNRTGTVLSPLFQNDSLKLPYLGGGGNLCLGTDNLGAITAVACGTGGGGGGGTWSTTTSQTSGRFVNYSNNTTDIVTIGSNSTTTAEYWFDPNTETSFLKGKIQGGQYNTNDENLFHFTNSITDNLYASNRYFLRSSAFVDMTGATDIYGYGAVLGKITAKNNSNYALIEGVYGYADVTQTANVTTSVGGRMIAYHDGSGAVTNQFGILADSGLRSSGNVTTNAGLYVNQPTLSSSGTITENNYGIYVADQSVGTGGKYAIFTAGTASTTLGGGLTVAGDTGMGTLTPRARAHVVKVNNSTSMGGGEVLRISAEDGNTLNTRNEISFSSNGIQNPDAIVGAQRTSATGYGYSDIYFATRPTATNVVPTERMRIAAGTGYVGIGTTSPYGRLSITGAGSSAGKAFVISDSSNVEIFNVSDYGRVGVNTTEPSGTFTVVGSVGSAPANNALTTMRLISSTASGVGVGPSLLFRGQTGNSTAEYGFAGIQGAKESATASNYDGYMALFTQRGSSAALTEAVRITSQGRVGIGTSTPGAVLEVAGATQITGTSGGVGSYVQFRNASTPMGIIGSDGSISGSSATALGMYVYGANPIDFWTNSARVMRLTAGGLVGIGTTTPANLVDINGNNPYLAIDSANAGNAGFKINEQSAERWRIDNIAAGDRLRILAGVTTEVMSLTQAGSVGIGSTSPIGKIGVNGSAVAGEHLMYLKANAATQRLILEGSTGGVQTFLEGGATVGLFGTITNSDFRIRTNYTDRLTVTATGRIGVANTSPLTTMSIGDVTTALGATTMLNSGLSISSSTAIAIGAENRSASHASSGGAFGLFYSNDGAAMASGDRLGGFLFGGSSSNTTLRNTAGMIAYATQNWVDGSAYGSRLTFEVNPNNSTSRSSIMTLLGNGNVGINVTSPNESLEVASTSGARMIVSDGGGASRKVVLITSPSASIGYGRVEAYDYGGSVGLPLVLNNAGQGNVGIGTTSPAQKLEVNGGVMLNTNTAKPACSSTVRGTFWFVKSAAGVKDLVEVCAKDATNAYAWRTIY